MSEYPLEYPQGVRISVTDQVSYGERAAAYGAVFGHLVLVKLSSVIFFFWLSYTMRANKSSGMSVHTIFFAMLLCNSLIRVDRESLCQLLSPLVQESVS